MLCKGLPIPNFNPKKDNFFEDNFFVTLHFTCTCIKFFTKSIQKNIAYFHNQSNYSVFVKVVLKGDNSNAFKDLISYHKRKMSLP